MFLRFLSFFLCLSISSFALAKSTPTHINLSHLERLLNEKCSLKDFILDCGDEDLVLRASKKLNKLSIKAANIEIQGRIEAEELTLTVSEDFILAQDASLFLEKPSSIVSQKELQIHGALFSYNLEILSPRVHFDKDSEIQVETLKITTDHFRTKNLLYAKNFQLKLSNKGTKRLSDPYAEFDGYLQAMVLTVLGQRRGSRFVIGKQGFIDAHFITVSTKHYLNLGKIRFSELNVNGQEHANSGKTAGGKYEVLAENVKSEESASYQVASSQIWGHDCKDQSKWDSKGKLGFYCQTMSAGESSVWRGDTVKLGGGSFFLDNTIVARELQAKIQTLYTFPNSIQRIVKTSILAKYILLDGSWTGGEASFRGDLVFFGPKSNVNIKNLEILARNKNIGLVSDLLDKHQKSELVTVEKIFDQLFEQEEQYRRAFARSLGNGQFAFERRWQMHQFRKKVYDTFKAQNAAWASYRLAQLTNEFEQSGAIGMDKQNFDSLKKFAFSKNQEPGNFPLLLMGAINSHNLKIRNDGSFYLDESSTLNVNNLLDVKTRGRIAINRKVRATLINLVAEPFISPESKNYSSQEKQRIYERQQLLFKGLLKRDSDNVLMAEGGEIYIGKAAQLESTDCTFMDVRSFYNAGKINTGCLRLRTDSFFSEEKANGRDVLVLDPNKPFRNTGTISSVNDLYIKVSEQISAKELGLIQAGSWITLDGEFDSEDVLTLLEGNSDQLKTEKVRIITSKPVIIARDVSSSFGNEIVAPSITLENDKKYMAEGDISLTANSVHSRSGSVLRSKGDLNIDAYGDVFQESERNSHTGRIKTSEFHAGGSLSMNTKGKYINIGSKLLAKETLVIKTEGGVVIVPLSWVETREESSGNFVTKKTTVIQEEKEQRAKLGGKSVEIETEATDSRVENMDWIGKKKLSPQIQETYRNLQYDEHSYTQFTGAGKVLATATRFSVIAVGQLYGGPAGAFAASYSMSFLESKVLNQKFDEKAALKRSVIETAASAAGATFGGFVSTSVGGTTGQVIGGASVSSTAYLVGTCLGDGCKNIEVNDLGKAALTGALQGAIGADGDSILEDASRASAATFIADAGHQGMQGKNINWEQAGENGLNSGVGYASGRITTEWLKKHSTETPVPNHQNEEKIEAKQDKPEEVLAEDKAKDLPDEEKKEPLEVKKPSKAKRKSFTKKQKIKEETLKTSEIEDVRQEKQEPKYDQAQEGIDYQGQPSSDEHFCFVAGTLVRTDAGHLPIEEVTTEHRVVSCSFSGEQCTFRKVLRTLTSKTAVLIHIGLASGSSIAASPNHPFFVPERGSFVAVEELTSSTMLLNIEGEPVAIQSLETEVLAQPVMVYNLAVEEDHNYYVSSADGGSPEDILVHNCNKFDCPGIASDLKVVGDATALGGIAAGATCAGLTLGCGVSAVTPGGQLVAIGAACPGAASACVAALGLGAASVGAYGGAMAMHMEAKEAKGASKVESRTSGLNPKGERGGSNVENPFNLIPTHRLTMSKKAFKDFKDGIATDGHIKKPIRYVEHEGKKYIVDGHHRARAAKELGLRQVPTEKVSLPHKGYKQIEDLLGN